MVSRGGVGTNPLRKQFPQHRELRRVPADDIGVRGVPPHEILMIGLGAIEGIVGLDLRGDRLCAITPLADLRAIGGRAAAPRRVHRHGRGTKLRSDVGTLPVPPRPTGYAKHDDEPLRTTVTDWRTLSATHR